ncbi:Protein SABRE [Capsicum chinense]|nr:Protein SABRE [Capsicum chinense]
MASGLTTHRNHGLYCSPNCGALHFSSSNLLNFRSLLIRAFSCLRFASRMLAWILRRAMGASVSFRVGGWKCLRDVVVKFNKVLICDLEVVMRASSKSIKKAKSRKSRKSGRGKWMVVANMARFLSVTVTQLVVKTPKATVEVKELTLDLSKDGGSKPELFVKLLLAPIFVHFGESRVSYDQSSVYAGSFPSNDGLLAMTEKVSAPFSCEEFSITCEFGHDREAGVVVRNVDIATGDVSIILNDELLFKRKGGDAFSSKDVAIKAVTESGTAEKPVKTSANLAIMKYASMFPEKLCFMLPKLDMKFVHREVALMVENNIMGIQLKGTKSRSFEDVGESKRVDVQMEFSEIHLLKDGGISVVEILKLDVVSSSYIPLQVIGCNYAVQFIEGAVNCWVVHSHHVFANNISSTGTVVHMELGEFNLNMSDEYREWLKESLFGVETNMGSLIYIAKVSVDWGKKDMDSPEDSLKYKTVLSVDVTGMGVHLTFRRIGSLVSTALSFKRLLKSLSDSGKKPHNRVTKSSKPSGKGIQLIKFNLEKCYLNVCGEVGLENSVVPDPTRVNYGYQGGRIVVSVSADGTPRTATITPTAPVELKKLKYSVS